MQEVAFAKLDPITVEVVRNKLDGIANEMQLTLIRSAFSPIVKEGLDASASLFTIGGETLAQAMAIPIHLGTLIPIVGKILTEYPLKTMRNGDIYIMNDPYLGGTHLPDVALVMPVFVGETPVAISAALTHHQDVGGMAPGSVPPNSLEIYQEGLRIPPLKLCSRDGFDPAVIGFIRQNVRMPDAFIGDLNAQVAACKMGVRRINELVGTYGTAHIMRIFDELLNRSETMTREAIRAIPEGTYHYVDYLDNDGVELDKRVRVEVTVTVKDGTIVCDFEGTSPQVKGPINCVASGSLAAACFMVRAITDPSIPTNGGCFRPIHLKLPARSLVNPIEPAPVNARTATIRRINDCLLGAFQGVLPDKVPAHSAGGLFVIAYGGVHSDGSRFVVGELCAGGSGGSNRCDGVDVIQTDVVNGMNLPAEVMEVEGPFRVHRIELRQDSGGAGQYRGGLGCLRECEVLDGEMRYTHRGERYFCPPGGSMGGRSGMESRSVIYRSDGTEEHIRSKISTVIRKGDRICIGSAGGGGYGDPTKRDRQRVIDDLKNEKVSLAAARDIYGLDV